MVGTELANMKVVGPDGVCVSQNNHRIDFSSFAGISTTVSELRIMNVSSLPGEVKQASSLFSQRMIGCAIWGSNNHLSGSLLRDVNGGGSFLCSNSTFNWCHTTSSERPSIVHISPPNIDSLSYTRYTSKPAELDNAEDIYTNQVYDGVARFEFTTGTVSFTRCEFKNMKYTGSGGSAIYLNNSYPTLSVISCSFSKCSVASSNSVNGGCIFLYSLHASTNTVDSCSFDDWYPTNGTNIYQYGGGIGLYRTTSPLQVTNSNFTLSGETTNTMNGGFFASYSSNTNLSFTFSNCRFIGDTKTTGYFLKLDTYDSTTGVLSVTDSEILNTNSQVEVKRIRFETSSGFTRTEISNTSIKYSGTSAQTHPHLFLDCKISQCSMYSEYASTFLILFSGTSFTGQPPNSSNPSLYLSIARQIVFHKCDFTDCSPAAKQSLIYTEEVRSLVVDTCTFTRCSGGKSIIDLKKTYSFFYFCTFTNVSGTSASVITTQLNDACFFEACRFDLEEDLTVLDIVVSSTDIACLNETAVIGCTSNRQMYFGTSWMEKQELTTVKIRSGEADKNEMRVGTWPTEPEIPRFISLSEALGSLQPSSLNTVITFSDGTFTESGLLELSQRVEIVGAGSNTSDTHSTQLTTKDITSKSTGKLTLQSLRLVPSSPLSVVASTKESGSLIVLNVIVEALSEHSASLFQLAAGSSEIRHSFFKNIESTESLICVSGTSSLAISNTLFLNIKRTSPAPTPVENTQCASCIEGKTSGEISVLYCRFGACTTNGRAGAIDLEKKEETSTFEMGFCYFDQNSAGKGVANASRGDDVVLKSFDDSQIHLDWSTIKSFPSVYPFLINSTQAVVASPAVLDIGRTGDIDPLTWSYYYKQLVNTFLTKYPLQDLLGSHLHSPRRIPAPWSVHIYGHIFSGCQADEGGVAYLRGGAIWVDIGNYLASSLSLSNVKFINNTAHNVDENGIDSGKGGAIFVKGTTSSTTALNMSNSRFEGNTAAFGNDMFLEEGVLGGADSTRKLRFTLAPLHQLVNVDSEDGRLVVEESYVLIETGTPTSRSPLFSVGSSLAVRTVLFSSTVPSSIATLSTPLVRFAPTPSNEDKLGSGSCDITNCSLTDFHFEEKSMFEIETSGRISFLLNGVNRVTTDLEEGKFISVKGQSFKQQIEPSLWLSNPTTADLPNLIGEDVSMGEGDKWRKGSLVYWLISPSEEIQINSDENAVDHPNCGSSTFKCTTLDSAFKSAGLNAISTLSLSISTSLSSNLLVASSLLIMTSSATQEIELNKNGSFVVANSTEKLSIESINFTVAQTCLSATLFVVEEGELSFSSCQIGATSSESALVLPESATTLIEVKSDGTLSLTDTLIQHIKFSHATLGTTIRLHINSPNTFEGTSKVGEIVSNGTGSHVLILASTELESSPISSFVEKFASWGPTTMNGVRFSKSEIEEFVVIDEDGRVDELIYHWNLYDGESLFVASDGGSHSKCGLSVLPCSSISANIEKVGDGKAIIVSSAVTESNGFVAKKDLTVKSSDNSKQIISVSCSTQFTTQGSSLIFENLTFVPLPPSSAQNAESLQRTDSLFVVKSGSIELTDCSLLSFLLADSPLITHTFGSLILNSCEISSITRSTGNGTVLETSLEGNISLWMNDVTFSSMTSSKVSALLSISLTPLDDSEPVPNYAFSLTNLQFVEMIESEDEESCFVSLVGSNLADWLDEGDSRFEGSYNESTQLSHLWSFDAFHSLPASLLFYLLPSEGPVGVSSSGIDMGKCGSNSIWCPTISKSLDRLSAQKTNKIVVMDEIDLSTSVLLPDGVIFSGNNSVMLCSCLVNDAGSFETTGVDFVSITSLDFSLPPSQSADAVIVHSSNKLTLSHLHISSRGKSSAVFIRMSSGSSEMSDIVVQSEMEKNSVLFSLLGGSVNMTTLTLETSVAENGSVVEMKGGSLSLTGMTLLSTKPIEGQLLSLSNSPFTLTDVKISKQTFVCPLFTFSSFGEGTIRNMDISGCSGSTLITANDGDELSIRNCIFTSLTPSSVFSEAKTPELCGWETSLIEITNSSADFHQTEFTSIHLGALSVSDSIMTMTGCIFSENTPSNQQWPSLRRNIKCSNGTIKITGIGRGDGMSPPHHWILADDCAVTKESENLPAPLFVPTLVANESKSILDKKLKQYSVNVVGTTMIPCKLKLEVFEHNATKSNEEGHPLKFDIPSLNPSKWTETELSYILPQSSLADLSKKSELRCRLLYADGQTTASFSLTGASKGNMAEGGVITSIVVPIVAVIIVAVLLIIIIALLCRRRKIQKEAEQASQELDVAEAGDVVKEDGEGQDDTIKPIFGSTGMSNNSMLMVSEDKQHGEHVHTLGTASMMSLKQVDALKCDGEPGIVSVDPRHTLYHHLHVEKARVVDKRKMGVRIVTGLERMIADHPSSELLSKLSPHWIILDLNMNTFLRIESLSQLLGSGGIGAQALSGSTKNEEDRRWNAPEQDSKEGETGNEQEGSFDRSKAAVFRLGLVLWEIETGQVPFGELDAVNASRQIRAGVMPLIHNWEDEDFADLVADCLSLSPDSRPSLADVKTRLGGLKSDHPPAVHNPPQQNELEKAVSGIETS
ncbi:hypothetical protein BLNAU_20361 [Blattamonas nauphoetae]|uniref:Protein kinase domain-containing protein n=1 Tax=Blattamonas nauphoetae TaxID=2049346 RepID=A0ABQ9X353_9EUKA|nr:hypothetical protein BLNAU_20361 [Blattamonas nauphoetae]